MPATITSATIVGIDAQLVAVEVDIIPGLPKVTVVGLPDEAIQESRERVRSAVRNSGFEFPLRRVTICLSPADIRKEGAGFDLPTALAVIQASHQIDDLFNDCLIVGELTLRGTCLPVSGAIAYAELAVRKKQLLVIPRASAAEAALIPGVRILPIDSLRELIDLALAGHLQPVSVSPPRRLPAPSWSIWPTIRGQVAAKRAAVITAAGGHNLLMVGPPGTGKTMMSEAVAELLPDLSDDEAVEVTKIASIAGTRRPHDPFLRRPPFRHPHHGASVAALVGGGRQPRPGELTLAHHGILFLDEFPEFTRDHLEALRQPLEHGRVVVNRVAGTMEFPAEVMLVAAMNPCPCGYAGDRTRPCSCSPTVVQRYMRRISGPILDRFDLTVSLWRVAGSDLQPPVEADDPRPRVAEAQRRAHTRNGGRLNSRLRGRELIARANLNAEATEFLRLALDRLQLSLRAHDRIIRVSRTIADLADSQNVTASHVAEATQFRPPFSLDALRRTTMG